MSFFSDVLIRSQNTVPKSEEPKAAAQETAIQSVFSVDTWHEDLVSGKRVLLVDDAVTTGSTFEATDTVLKADGASWVGAAVLTVQTIGSLK